MNKSESLLKEHSIRSEYEVDYSEKCTKLKITLESAILSGDIETVRKMSSNIEEIPDLKLIFREDLNLIKLYLASAITLHVNGAIKNGLPKDEAENAKKKYYIKIANCQNRTDLKLDYFQIVEELTVGMNRYSIKQYSSIVKMAIEYIHNNKFRFIYSKDVSKAINVNRSYLSKKFKEDVGQNITDYIHIIKMNLAIELMESNLYKYNEVADLLGYSNYAYFSKVFKKFHNVTPSLYMKIRK